MRSNLPVINSPIPVIAFTASTAPMHATVPDTALVGNSRFQVGGG